MSQDAPHRRPDGGPTSGEPQPEPLPHRGDKITPSGPKRRPRGSRASLVKQMWCTAEAQVREIEERLQQEPQTPDERERDARVLAVLAKTLRELAALDESKRDGKAATDSATKHDDPIPRDMDELRRALARKLEAFIAGATPAVSDDP